MARLDSTPWLGHVWRGRRAQDLVERTRWLFYVCAIVSALLTLGGGVSDATPVSALLVLASLAVFAGTLTYRYRSQRAPLVLDAADILATLVLTDQRAAAGVAGA